MGTWDEVAQWDDEKWREFGRFVCARREEKKPQESSSPDQLAKAVNQLGERSGREEITQSTVSTLEAGNLSKSRRNKESARDIGEYLSALAVSTRRKAEQPCKTIVDILTVSSGPDNVVHFHVQRVVIHFQDVPELEDVNRRRNIVALVDQQRKDYVALLGVGPSNLMR